jgi:hypothetical protein
LDFLVKTVLAPNAPWPKPDEKLVKRFMAKVKIKQENVGLDYFLNTHEELNNSKTATKHRTRDKLSGRFKSH